MSDEPIWIYPNIKDDIKNKKYGDIPDDLAECVKKLKDAVSEASELTTDFVKNVLGQDTVKSAEAVILPLIPDAGKVLDSNAAKSAAELFKEMLHPDKAKMQSSAAQSATPNKNTVKGPGVRGWLLIFPIYNFSNSSNLYVKYCVNTRPLQ